MLLSIPEGYNVPNIAKLKLQCFVTVIVIIIRTAFSIFPFAHGNVVACRLSESKAQAWVGICAAAAAG